MTKDQIKEAVAKGFKNADWEIDTELAKAIVEEVWKADTTPNLGCASTLMLITELDARVRMAAAIGEDWPKYRTVDASL